MKRRIFAFALAALFTWGTAPGGRGANVAELIDVPAGRVELAPSFEACSYYFRPAASEARGFVVEFRREGAGDWRRAFAPVSDSPAGLWKGSLFNLAEDTAWEVRVRDDRGLEIVAPQRFRTWSSHPRIARTIDLSTLPAATNGLVISDQGTPDGWIKYTAPRGWTVRRAAEENDPETAAIVFRRARYVILEGVTIVGGARHGVLVEQSESVRILNCDISGFGRVGVQQFTNTEARGKYADGHGRLINYDAGVSVDRSARTVVERCFIHDPRHRANSWMFSHPAGPTAMHLNSTRGGNVVRWNDFVGSDEHRWNDVIEASSNGSPDGGFFRDSDISGNFLAFGNDDGVELEGGGMNVRFYRNKVEGTLCGVSTGACLLGPQFVFENLIANPGDESGLALVFFKNSHGEPQGGKRHFINNTLFSPTASAYGSYGQPIGTDRIGYLRNNIFVGRATRGPDERMRRDDFDRDLYWMNGGDDASRDFLTAFRTIGQERNGLALDPQLVAPAAGDFHLGGESPARDCAAAVANLTSAGANLGAFAQDDTEVPFRPLALTATPRQLDFTAPREMALHEVRLALPATAKEAVDFEIRQNRVFSWFKVTPARGHLAPGQHVTLTVAVDAAALHGRPRFRGAFLVRTPDGLSRPVTVYAASEFHEEMRPAASPNSLYLDASGWSLPALDTRIVLKQAGSYSLLIRAAPPSVGQRDANFMIAVDDGEPERASVHASYQWSAGATHARVSYLHALGQLPAGEHRVRIASESNHLAIREFIVTDQPAAFFVQDWQRER